MNWIDKIFSYLIEWNVYVGVCMMMFLDGGESGKPSRGE